MTNHAPQLEKTETLTPLFEQENIELRLTKADCHPSSWIIPLSQLRKYAEPGAGTAVPLEYAFHLLGDVTGKTVVDLGCNDGFNTVILASLGAKVIAVDASEKNLSLTASRSQANGVERNVILVHAKTGRIPIDDRYVDRVFCREGLPDVDPLDIARQIRRVLKPGGTAVFFKRGLTREEIGSISRAVGRPRRCREFTVRSIVSRLLFARGLSSSFVWEACKEC